MKVLNIISVLLPPVLPYVQKPEENPSFSLYFTRAWQDSVLVSLHNLLATVFQCMPQPTLTSYESEAALVKRLQDKLYAVGKVTNIVQGIELKYSYQHIESHMLFACKFSICSEFNASIFTSLQCWLLQAFIELAIFMWFRVES